MERTLPSIVLRPGEADRVIAGHPWIYAGAVDRLTRPAEDGAIVQIKDHRQRFLGVGFYNSKSKIQVRVLDGQRVEIDHAFFLGRLRAALAWRQKHLPEASSFRVVNAEGDFLSGLVIDKYEDVLVLQTSALGMDQRKQTVVAVLRELLAPRAIVERNDIASRKFEGLTETRGVLEGTLEGPVPVRLNGLQMEVDVLGGHKTGCYLDQQVNYEAVARYAGGGQILDCFAFLGGFALHAARAGAARVEAVDQSADAMARAEANAKRNGLADRCSFHTANVFDWLKAQTQPGPHEKAVPRFDLVILDPPSFTRNRASIPDALRGYKEIHLRALRLLRPNGVLATFCCSHHINAETFQQVILEAAFDARRVLRRVAVFSQAPDHPIVLSVPETEYLKGYAFELAG